MKKYIFILGFLSTNLLNAQILQGFVKDSISNEKLPLSNLVFLHSNMGVYGDNEGLFKIDITNHLNDTLKITHVGYQSLFLPLSIFKEKRNENINFSLVAKSFELNEVSVTSKKINYTKNNSLGEKREGNVGMFSLIGFETTGLVENPFNKKGKLKSIKLDIKKNKNADFVTKFNIKIYKYNKEKNQPGDEILMQNLVVSPKNKNYILKIDMINYNIIFPTDGICIGIENIDTANAAKKDSKIGPGLRFTNSENKQLTWYNYRNRGWYGGFLNRKENSGNLIIGVEVLTEN